jgi:hypothetical protein
MKPIQGASGEKSTANQRLAFTKMDAFDTIEPIGRMNVKAKEKQ